MEGKNFTLTYTGYPDVEDGQATNPLTEGTAPNPTSSGSTCRSPVVTTLGPDPGPTLSIEQWMAEGVTTDAFGYPIGQTLPIGTRVRYIDGELVRPNGEVEPVEPDPAPQRVERDRDRAARAAIFEAVGLQIDLTLLDRAESDDLTAYDATPPDEEPTPKTRHTAQGPPSPKVAARAYVVRERGWRERIGLPARRKTVPPSRTPEVRRERHIREKAVCLGISFADAQRLTPKREVMRR